MSSATLKIFGKKAQLPAGAGSGAGAWKFSVRPGGWVLAERSTDDGSVQRVRLSIQEFRGKFWANLSGRAWFGDIVQKTRGSDSGGGDSDLTAQFPGKVRKVLVKDGAKVKEGESLILVEAMKMEFTIKAPSGGTVTKVRVTEGQQLSPGDQFVDFAPAEGGS